MRAICRGEDEAVKCVLALLVGSVAAIGQTETAGISGTLLDAKTLKPVPAAFVLASRGGAPPFTRNTKSGGDGAFQIQGLPAGSYSLCVQAADQLYLDPCQWNGSPATVTLAPGQNVTGISIRLAAAAVVSFQIQDAQMVLSQLTKDARRPDLTLGVWGPGGLYYPARAVSTPDTAPTFPGAIPTYGYQIAVPRDIALNLYIASRDLELGDATGVALPSNTSRQTTQIANGDSSPKIFTFTVLRQRP